MLELQGDSILQVQGMKDATLSLSGVVQQGWRLQVLLVRLIVL